VALAALTCAASVPAPAGPAVTVSGKTIQLDGQPTFLLGVSFFGALDVASPRDEDLDTLKRWGVTVVRVWAHWGRPIYQRDGTLSPQGRVRLLQLVQRLQARGLVLELALLRPGQLPGQRYVAFSSEAARVRAVTEIASALREYRHVLFDLYNEHDHPDGPISHAAARVLRDAVKAVDPGRLVTISSTGTHLVTPDSRVGEAEARNLREEASQDVGSVGVDLVAPHFPRTDDWAPSTAARVAAVRSELDRIGRNVPVYLNEERRAEPGSEMAADIYQRAFTSARDAGAAGWVFHTKAGYELDTRSFVASLGFSERAALQRLKKP